MSLHHASLHDGASSSQDTPYSTSLDLVRALSGSRLRVTVAGRGTVTGTFVCFDKQRSILLSNVREDEAGRGQPVGLLRVQQDTILDLIPVSDESPSSIDSIQRHMRPQAARRHTAPPGTIRQQIAARLAAA